MLRYKTKTRPGLVALYDIRPGNGAGPFLQPRSPHGAAIEVKFCTSKRTQVPVGPAKFDVNWCNESPLWGEKPDFWPVSKCKFNTGSLPLCGILPVKIIAMTREIFSKNVHVCELFTNLHQ